MTPEYWFNSLVLRTTSRKKLLSVKTGRDVIGSRSPVTAVTTSSEIRPYAPSLPIAKFASGIGSGTC